MCDAPLNPGWEPIRNDPGVKHFSPTRGNKSGLTSSRTLARGGCQIPGDCKLQIKMQSVASQNFSERRPLNNR
jgi:hypothetical protein